MRGMIAQLFFQLHRTIMLDFGIARGEHALDGYTHHSSFIACCDSRSKGVRSKAVESRLRKCSKLSG